MLWTWDPDKDRINRKKHGPSLESAVRIFAARFIFSGLDSVENGEERQQTIGLIDSVTVIAVAHAYREDIDGDEIVRLTSGPRATSHDRR